MPPKNKTQDNTQDKPQTLKVKFWYYVQNGGDGSAHSRFFDSLEAAERYAKFDEEYGDGFTEAISSQTLEFTLDGQLYTPNPIHNRDDGSELGDDSDDNTFADDEIIGLDEDGFVTLIGSLTPEMAEMLDKVSKKNK